MEQKQVSIVCDTNIWYYLSDGTIDPEQVAGKQLVGTFISGYEFCCSPNGIKGYSKLRDAIIAYDKYATKSHGEIPAEYIKMLSGHKSCIPKWAEITEQLKLVRASPSITASSQVIQAYSQHANQIAEALKPFTDMIDEHRRQIKVKGSHKKQMALPEVRIEHKEITKRVITNLVDGLKIDWTQFELFLNTFDEWLRQLSLQSTLKMSQNDWNDLVNLVYVQPGSFYWTYDQKKTKVFIKEIGLDHYLF